MIGRCLGVHTDIGHDTVCPTFLCISLHEERVDVAYLASYYVLDDTLFLPSSRRVIPFFLLGLARCANIARANSHIYTCDPTEASGRKFLHAICRAAAYFGAHSDRRFAVDLSVTEARRGPLIWKYLVTVIKDTLGWTPSPFHCIDQGIFEERRSLLVDEPKRNDFIRE